LRVCSRIKNVCGKTNARLGASEHVTPLGTDAERHVLTACTCRGPVACVHRLRPGWGLDVGLGRRRPCPARRPRSRPLGMGAGLLHSWLVSCLWTDLQVAFLFGMLALLALMSLPCPLSSEEALPWLLVILPVDPRAGVKDGHYGCGCGKMMALVGAAAAALPNAPAPGGFSSRKILVLVHGGERSNGRGVLGL
jgi:hypothetical protein